MFRDVSMAEAGHVVQPRVSVGRAPRVWACPGLMPWGPFRWQVTLESRVLNPEPPVAALNTVIWVKLRFP